MERVLPNAVAFGARVWPEHGGVRMTLTGQVFALMGGVATDEQSRVRQVAAVSATGQVAAHTGDGCIPVAGHVTGDGYSAQANMMLREGVPEAMAAATKLAGSSGDS